MPKSGNKRLPTAEVARRLVEPIIAERGLILWDVRFEKEGGSWYLRYFIDKEGGVNIQDCEYVSRAVEKRLDEEDPIEQSYILEVGSPGTERELTKSWHFEQYAGRAVRVKLFAAVNGGREHTGTLVSRGAEELTLRDLSGGETAFAVKQIASVRLCDDYDTDWEE
jgi:ribosome maturation factor RimP